MKTRGRTEGGREWGESAATILSPWSDVTFHSKVCHCLTSDRGCWPVPFRQKVFRPSPDGEAESKVTHWQSRKEGDNLSLSSTEGATSSDTIRPLAHPSIHGAPPEARRRDSGTVVKRRGRPVKDLGVHSLLSVRHELATVCEARPCPRCQRSPPPHQAEQSMRG